MFWVRGVSKTALLHSEIKKTAHWEALAKQKKYVKAYREALHLLSLYRKYGFAPLLELLTNGDCLDKFLKFFWQEVGSGFLLPSSQG